MINTSKPKDTNLSSRRRGGQALVEYMLAVSVLAIALAVGFLYLSDSTSDSFLNTRLAVQQVYP